MVSDRISRGWELSWSERVAVGRRAAIKEPHDRGSWARVLAAHVSMRKASRVDCGGSVQLLDRGEMVTSVWGWAADM